MTSTPLQTSDISIIIPTLNEEEQIGNWQRLQSLLGGRDPETSMPCEVIIVDGGSSDQTVSLARSQGFRVESCQAGRGAQLNHGAREAGGRVLLFLHADTELPSGFIRPLLDCLNNTSAIAGAFSLAIQDAGLLMKLICLGANLRSQLLSLPYGDQAIFIRRDDFLRIGGFPETPIMEDFIFIRRARREGRVSILAQRVTTSARRWQRLGVIRTTLVNQLVILGYYARVPLQKLASLYRR
jgi:rSAM/selenodomain-associated transferase 2